MSEFDATDLEALMRAIHKRFNDVFLAGEAPNTPTVLWDNDGVTETPDDPGAAGYWVRFSVRPGESRIVEIGGGQTLHRTPGVAIAQFFAPLGQGDRSVLRAIDRCRTIFSGKTANLVRYRSASIRVVGRSVGGAAGTAGEGRWWQINLHIPFQADFQVATS